MPTIHWSEVFAHLSKLAIAFALTLPIGWDREAVRRGPGLRTFPLVAVGSCGYLLMGQSMFLEEGSQARLLYGLMTGIGFIGGGSILKENGAISGTATAASIWNVGAIGAAVAWQRFEIALVLAIANFATLRWLGHALGADEETS
ncbi:MAG: MgtC/SapB family protein [Myxococcales bacterium]|nr:MgtC/SapB family protein [Myxococcales bacterium]